MESVTRTIYAAHNQMCARNRQSILPFPGSTLNEKFNVTAVGENVYTNLPTDSYLAIGKGGALYTSSGNTISVVPKKHLATHCSLYDHMPFIARRVSEDLTSLTGADDYRLRVVKDIDGVAYAFYFLRVIDTTGMVTSLERRTVSNGTFTSVAFTPSVSDKTPSLPAVSELNVVNPVSGYLISTATVTVTLSNEDIGEIISACDLYFADEDKPASVPFVVNELAIVSGVEKNVRITIGSLPVSRKEVGDAQISTFIYKFFSLKEDSADISLSFDMGSSTPISDGNPVFSY